MGNIPRSHLKAIELRDAQRRLVREAEELAELQGLIPTTTEQVGYFLPNHARDTRYSEPWKGLNKVRAVGVAPGTEQESDGTPTVRVIHADGTTEVRDVSSFRRGTRNRNTAQRTTQVARQPETAQAKYPTHILTGE